MKRIITILAVSALAMIGGLIYVSTASAGSGPNGFVNYAKQGIVNENSKVYGKGNSPWNVACTDHPSYHPLSDTVTCHITLKP